MNKIHLIIIKAHNDLSTYLTVTSRKRYRWAGAIADRHSDLAYTEVDWPASAAGIGARTLFQFSGNNGESQPIPSAKTHHSSPSGTAAPEL